MRLRTFGILGAAGLLVATAALPAAAQSPAAPTGTLKIGVTLPLSGGAGADGIPTRKGAELAVAQANAAGGIGGYQLELQALDHAVAGKYNEQQAALDMQTFVGDASVVGVVGPYNSAVAKAQIPISNAGGLLQCSPANTNPSLTLPPAALDFRQTHPDKINYVRVAANDNIQGPAMSDYAYTELGLRNIVVVDDVTSFGYGVADTFQTRFQFLGGFVPQRIGATPDTTDFNGIISQFPLDVDGVYYGGVVTSGAGLLLKQMRQQGVTVPFLGPDGIVNGAGDADGSLIQVAGLDAITDTYGTTATIGDFAALGLGDGRAAFEAAFAEQFAGDADFNTPGAYSAAAYACAQVILQSLEAVLTATPDADLAAIREGVRAHASDPANTFETVVGPTAFDKNGDIAIPVISWFKADAAAKDGIGDWVFIKQQVYGTEG